MMHICKCDHDQAQHESVIVSMGRMDDPSHRITYGKCLVDGCDECSAFVVRPVPRWVVLVRMADYAIRFGERTVCITKTMLANGDRDVNWSATARMPIDVDVETHEGDELHLLEGMCGRLMERVRDLEEHERGRGRTPPSSARRGFAMTRTCAACTAPAGVWCVPLHDGERSQGDWFHPERYLLDSIADNFGVDAAIRWARTDPADCISIGGNIAINVGGIIRRLDLELRELRRKLVKVDQREPSEHDAEMRVFADAVRSVDARALAMIVATREEASGVDLFPIENDNARTGYVRAVLDDLRKLFGMVNVKELGSMTMTEGADGVIWITWRNPRRELCVASSLQWRARADSSFAARGTTVRGQPIRRREEEEARARREGWDSALMGIGDGLASRVARARQDTALLQQKPSLTKPTEPKSTQMCRDCGMRTGKVATYGKLCAKCVAEYDL